MIDILNCFDVVGVGGFWDWERLGCVGEGLCVVLEVKIEGEKIEGMNVVGVGKVVW